MRVPTLLVFATVQPVLFVLLFTYAFGDAIHVPGVDRYIDYLLPGIFVLAIGFGASQTGVAIAEDLATGMIDRFWSLPITAAAVLAGRVAADAVRNLFVVALMIAVGAAIGFRFHARPAAALAAVALAVATGLAFSWLNLLLGLVVRDPESAGLTSTTTQPSTSLPPAPAHTHPARLTQETPGARPDSPAARRAWHAGSHRQPNRQQQSRRPARCWQRLAGTPEVRPQHAVRSQATAQCPGHLRIGPYGAQPLESAQNHQFRTQLSCRPVGEAADHIETSLRALSRGLADFLCGWPGRSGWAARVPGRSVGVAGLGVACPKSWRAGCEPAALESEPFPGCPPRPVITARAAGWASAWRRA